MNIFNELGGLAISTRLQQLSDQFRKDGALIYKANNIDFEPKWFPVIYALHVKSALSILELSEEIGYAHPSTITLLKELEKEGLIESFKDAKDERKRMVRLSEKAQLLIRKMQPVWEKIRKAAENITNTANNLLLAMDETEYQLRKEGFFDRYQRLSQEETTFAVQIIDYTPEHAKAFYDLNYAWISDAYEVEPEDEKVLEDPEKYYLKDGGAILMALYQGEPVGTCALKQGAPGVVEMSKMTVSKEMRGKKIGDLLGNAVIEKARQLGAKKIILYSNKKGSAAGINLYKKLGFVEVELTGHNFKRADIKMELELL
ncbi:bifunctional helix-turn-helix transcriptional regulator/GNAT family N-acetyltransferase [Dyadobacter psychrophilus]|uniref:Transcriptional regulator, MarR family with acetyltransferase activity n=1 Tax=Dyadobacter psychrophilus TaxID=651661 RepID=A0A1T5FAC1_9BACT|nr:bifunctional helix-turn-helix transcriptional regulator/GNAT family N-acetyltransferase [Dyadobacter psychrophilus]SKB93076.1 transcriptional regulator, MarR family with acetyltransferase activity [Dyadobacter psychrophilus]